jgi:hypothetical protein
MFHSKTTTMAAAQGNTAQAFAGWRHPVASSEVLVVLHQAMCPVLYGCIRVAIEIASNSPEFIIVVDYLFAHNLS